MNHRTIATSKHNHNGSVVHAKTEYTNTRRSGSHDNGIHSDTMKHNVWIYGDRKFCKINNTFLLHWFMYKLLLSEVYRIWKLQTHNINFMWEIESCGCGCGLAEDIIIHINCHKVVILNFSLTSKEHLIGISNTSLTNLKWFLVGLYGRNCKTCLAALRQAATQEWHAIDTTWHPTSSQYWHRANLL